MSARRQSNEEIETRLSDLEAIPSYQEYLLTSTNTVTADTYVDVTGALATLTPGTWDIGFDGVVSLRNVTGTSSPEGNIAITDSGNNILGNAVRYFKETDVANATTRNMTAYCVARNITVTVTTLVKLRIRCAGSAAAQIAGVNGANQSGSLTDPDSQSIFWARKIAD